MAHEDCGGDFLPCSNPGLPYVRSPTLSSALNEEAGTITPVARRFGDLTVAPHPKQYDYQFEFRHDCISSEKLFVGFSFAVIKDGLTEIELKPYTYICVSTSATLRSAIFDALKKVDLFQFSSYDIQVVAGKNKDGRESHFQILLDDLMLHVMKISGDHDNFDVKLSSRSNIISLEAAHSPTGLCPVCRVTISPMTPNSDSMSCASPDTSSRIKDNTQVPLQAVDPTDIDCLCGRLGGKGNSHEGNKTYIELVKHFKHEYSEQPDNLKNCVAKAIYAAWTRDGRRFLDKCDNGGWVESNPEKVVRKKICQAMRDQNNPKKKEKEGEEDSVSPRKTADEGLGTPEPSPQLRCLIKLTMDILNENNSLAEDAKKPSRAVMPIIVKRDTSNKNKVTQGRSSRRRTLDDTNSVREKGSSGVDDYAAFDPLSLHNDDVLTKWSEEYFSSFDELDDEQTSHDAKVVQAFGATSTLLSEVGYHSSIWSFPKEDLPHCEEGLTEVFNQSVDMDVSTKRNVGENVDNSMSANPVGNDEGECKHASDGWKLDPSSEISNEVFPSVEGGN